MYILELQKFNKDHNVFRHMGYLNKMFLTKEEACDYYDKHNKHMRSLNKYNTYRSDWDPVTQFRYVIREYDREYLNIPDFIR